MEVRTRICQQTQNNRRVLSIIDLTRGYLESEDELIKSKDYTGYYEEVKPMSYQIFYIIGASVFGVSLLGAFIIYLVKGKKSYN